MNQYERGSTAMLEAVYVDGVGNLVTPTTPLVSIRNGLGVEVVTDAVPTAESEGVYYYELALAADAPLGVWVATWSGVINGSLVSADDPFEVVVVSLAVDGRPCQVWSDTVSCPADVATLDPEVTARALRIATGIIWAASGRRYGICSATIRPCRDTGSCDWASLGMTPWVWGAPASYFGPASPFVTDPWCRSCGDSCGCHALEEVRLPHSRVRSVTQVLIDGAPLEPSAYRVDEYGWLVRLDGGKWPSCQDLELPTTEAGTWEISYTYGTPVPEGGKWAVERYACELAKASVGMECELPERVQTITRQGITVSFVDSMDFLAKGRTGLAPVDAWLASVNKHGLARRSRMYRVDQPPLGRRVGT